MKFNNLHIGMIVAEVLFKYAENMRTNIIIIEILDIKDLVAKTMVTGYFESGGKYMIDYEPHIVHKSPTDFGLALPVDKWPMDDKISFIQAIFEAK